MGPGRFDLSSLKTEPVEHPNDSRVGTGHNCCLHQTGHKIEKCLSQIIERTAEGLEEGRKQGDIPADCDPLRMASLLVDCWEGAALRSRLPGECRAADPDARLSPSSRQPQFGRLPGPAVWAHPEPDNASGRKGLVTSRTTKVA